MVLRIPSLQLGFCDVNGGMTEAGGAAAGVVSTEIIKTQNVQ